jgi:hypothetical protein
MSEGWHLILLKTKASKVSFEVRQPNVMSKHLD